MKWFPTVCAIFLGLPVMSVAETVKDREGAVRADKAEMEASDRWIYNDVQAGFDQARVTGKPLMVVLRCVPCLACMGLDAEVLMENDTLEPLMDEFVRVRLINANAIDLSRFQFDFDLSFSVLFFNADGTIYGRFGSWEHQRDSANRATKTLEQALQGALALHREFPAHRESLKGKTGPPSRFKTPVSLPGMTKTFTSELDWEGKVVQSCVHCHQIGDALRRDQRATTGQIDLKWILPYPSPSVLGLEMSEDRVTQVASVDEGSIAAAAGVAAGDRLIELEGQPLISIADLSWVLHHSPDEGAIQATVLRGGEEVSLQMPLPKNWRKGADISRRVGTWPMRAMAFGGMKLETVAPDRRTVLGLAEDVLALEAIHVGQYNQHALAKKSGFRKGDILIEIDGDSTPLTESQLLTEQLTQRAVGARVPVTVLRAGTRLALELPTQ